MRLEISAPKRADSRFTRGVSALSEMNRDYWDKGEGRADRGFPTILSTRWSILFGGWSILSGGWSILSGGKRRFNAEVLDLCIPLGLRLVCELGEEMRGRKTLAWQLGLGLVWDLGAEIRGRKTRAWCWSRVRCWDLALSLKLV